LKMSAEATAAATAAAVVILLPLLAMGMFPLRLPF
jgi:hypothetical protein